jgi:Leucine-rich repeat (LRR) protein
MIISDKILPTLFKGRNIDELTTIYLDNKNVMKITLKSSVFDNIMFLSLRSNHIKEIDFITNFRNLWYLDLRENPVKFYL